MKGKCCGFKFLDKIFRDKVIHIYSIFSISMCSGIQKASRDAGSTLGGFSNMIY